PSTAWEVRTQVNRASPLWRRRSYHSFCVIGLRPPSTSAASDRPTPPKLPPTIAPAPPRKTLLSKTMALPLLVRAAVRRCVGAVYACSAVVARGLVAFWFIPRTPEMKKGENRRSPPSDPAILEASLGRNGILL